MKIELVFPVGKVKRALNTESELLPPEVRDIMSILTIDVSDISTKYKDVELIFFTDKLRAAYDDALSKGLDEVTIIYEPPTAEDFERYGFVRHGDFMVKPC